MDIVEEDSSDEEAPAAKATAPSSPKVPAKPSSPEAPKPKSPNGSSESSSNEGDWVKVKTPVHPDLNVAETDAGVKAGKNKANSLFQAGDLKECVRWFEKCIWVVENSLKTYPEKEHSVLYSNLALAHQKLGMHDKVVVDGERAAKLNPENAKAIYRRATSLFELRRYAEAKEGAEATVRLTPDNAEAKQLLRNAISKVGEEEAAKARAAATEGKASPKASQVAASSNGSRKMGIVEEDESDEEPTAAKAAAPKAASPAAKANPKASPAAAALSGFRKMEIVEEDDSDEKPPAAKAAAPKAPSPAAKASPKASPLAAAPGGFRKMEIVEEDESDDEPPAAKAAAPKDASPAAKASLKAAPAAAAPGGFRKMDIVEEDDSDDEPPAPKAAAPKAAPLAAKPSPKAPATASPKATVQKAPQEGMSKMEVAADSYEGANIEGKDPFPFHELQATKEGVLEAKEKASKSFLANDLTEALRWFGKAIHVVESTPVDFPKDQHSILYSNRALAHLKLNLYDEAARDCTAALELNTMNVKANFRRADARFRLGNYAGALEDCEALKKYYGETTNPDVDVLMEKVQLKMKETSLKPAQPKEVPAKQTKASAGATPSAAVAPSGFRKMDIVEEDDTDDEPPAEAAAPKAASFDAKPSSKASPAAAAPSGFRKMEIVEESDSDEEPPAAKAAPPKVASPAATQSSKASPAAAAPSGFRKMDIVEEDDSDDEPPAAKAAAPKAAPPAAKASANGSSAAAAPSGFRKMEIVEEDDSDEEPPAAKATTRKASSPAATATPKASPSAAAPSGFRKMEIVEEDESDEEHPAAKAATPKTASPVATPSPKAASPPTATPPPKAAPPPAQAKPSPKVSPASAEQKFAPPSRAKIPPPPDDIESTAEGVEAAKARGNACFQQGDLEGAVRWFSGALAHATKLGLKELQGVLHSNRALVYSKQGAWAKVSADCTAAVDLGGKTTVKAQYRRAQARLELDELTGALHDVNAVLASYGDATNAEAEALKQRILAGIQEKKAKLQKERLEATVVTRKGPVAVPETSPKTPYEVARQFSALKRYPDQLAEYVRLRVPPTVLRAVFKKNMIEADLIERFLEVLTRPGFFPAATCRDYCDAILETQSGDTQLLMLSDSEKNIIRAALAGTSPRPTDARLQKAGLLE